MAEIERWITVNGVHIPIMKGESKMSAVGRFIKEKRSAVKNKLKQETGIYTNKFRNAKSSKERTAATKELAKISAREQLYGNDAKIKGYKTKLKDADKAYKKEWDRLTPDVKKAQENLDAAKKRSFYDSDTSKAIDKDYREKNKRNIENTANRLLKQRRAMTFDDNVYELGDIAEQQLTGKISKYKADKMMDKVGEKFRRSHYQWSGDRYKLKEDKLRNTGRYSEKAILNDYRKNYTNAELLDHKRQLDKFKKDFKQDYSGRNEDISARNYRSITTVLAERKAAARLDYKQYKKDHPKSTKTFDEFFKDRLY